MTAGTGGDDRSEPDCLAVAAEVLQVVRRAKSEAKVSMRTPVTVLTVTAPGPVAELFALVEEDLRNAGVVEQVVRERGDALVIGVELGDAPAKVQRGS